MSENKLTLMFVDDEMAVRESLALVFEGDYNVLTAGSGQEALEHLKNSKIDLVLCDIRMPGMDGITVLKKLKEVDENIKVIMVTAAADVDTGIDALQFGASDYVIKPYDIDQLQAKVKHFLGQA